MSATPRYYVPHSSVWPIIGSVALFLTAFGAATLIHQTTGKVAASGHFGAPIFYTGLAVLAFMMFGWFGTVIRESLQGLVSPELDRSYRLGMLWFIASEVMFFAGFFGALFYARAVSVPWLAGAGDKLETHLLLWPDFADTWPLFITPGGTTTGDDEGVGAALHQHGDPGLEQRHDHACALGAAGETGAPRLKLWLGVTIALGVTFLTLQVIEYLHAFRELGLGLGSGIYGSTFFMLTGFHGAHVTLGVIMLTIMMLRILQRPLHAGEPFRLRGDQLVLALRGRDLGVPVHVRLLVLARCSARVIA